MGGLVKPALGFHRAVDLQGVADNRGLGREVGKVRLLARGRSLFYVARETSGGWWTELSVQAVVASSRDLGLWLCCPRRPDPGERLGGSRRTVRSASP